MDTVASDREISAYNPIRRAPWRCDRVVKILSKRPARAIRRSDDHYVRAYHRLLDCSLAAGDDDKRRQAVFREYPAVAAAHCLHYSPDREACQLVQARILARESDEEIANRLGIESPVIQYYEKIFFDIRERLDAHDYIVKAAIRPKSTRWLNKCERATELRGYTYRLFGYFGGSLAIDALSSGFTVNGKPQNVKCAKDWLQSVFEQTATTRAAAAAAASILDGSMPALKVIKLAAKLNNARKKGK